MEGEVAEKDGERPSENLGAVGSMRGQMARCVQDLTVYSSKKIQLVTADKLSLSM